MMETKEIKLPNGKYQLIVVREYHTETIECKDIKALNVQKKLLGIKPKKKPNAKSKNI